MNPHQKEINKYIIEPEDFLDLPEGIQDKLTYNSELDYISIWDKLNNEHKFQIILNNQDFDYVPLWNKLGIVERQNVIQYTRGFDWKTYTPNPSSETLNLLLNRHDFFAEDIFDDLSYENKLRVCSKRDFMYQDFWEKLTDNLKVEIIKRNKYFDPKPYFKELQETVSDDYDETKLFSKETIKRTLLDIYCDRNNGNLYDSVWFDIDIHQKMNIAIKNHDFVVGNKTDELYELFKNFPFKMIDFLDKKVIPKPTSFNIDVEICFDEMSPDIKDLSIKLFKSYHLINLNQILKFRTEIKKGNTITISMDVELEKYLPICIVKVDDIEEIKHRGTTIKKGYYLYHIHNDKYTRIKDYSHILREAKLERLLNNIEE